MIKLTFVQKAATPAYSVIAVANRLGLTAQFLPLDASKSVELQGPSGLETITLSSVYPILRYLSKSNAEASSTLGVGHPVKSSQIDYWLDFCKDSLGSDQGYKPLAAAFSKLDTHLKLRSYIVGYHLTLADIACWGALRSIPIFTKQLKTGADVGAYLIRWFQHVESLPFVAKALSDIEKAVSDANKSRKDQGSFDIGLKDAAEGKVVTRFPPEPSGYLHIGHAKAALLNEYFARLYKGKMIVRFDDTNPSKEKSEFEESIKEDLSLLGITPDVVSHTSDYFDKMHELAITLIKKSKAFADDSTQEVMRAERMEGKESVNRNNSVEENLRRFAEMTKGSEEGLKNCLRAKIDMSDKNGTMRDPVIFRCNLTPHHQTGTKWKVYPTYDFACPIVDALEGVTHALRTMEYRDRNAQYEWFLKALDLRWVHIWDFSRINFVYTLLSKRKLTWFVEEGLVSGWDDPRFPTVRGIRRRGMTIQALREYILMQGASQKTLELEWDKIWSLNKKVIDPIAPRHTAIARDKITKVQVVAKDAFETYAKDLPKHKKNPDVGTKKTVFSTELYIEFADAKTLAVGEEVTFMDWGNVIVERIEWSADKSFVAMIDIKLNLDGDFKKTEKKLTWLSRAVPANSADLAPVKLLLLDYDYLINKKKLEEEDEVKDFVTKVSEFKTEAWGDANLKACKKGDIIQLERKGYYIVDQAYDSANAGSVIHLISIPDGRVASTVSKAEETNTSNNKAAEKKKPEDKRKPEAQNSKGEKKESAPAASPQKGKQEKASPAKEKAPASSASASASSTSKMYTSRPIYDKEPEFPATVGQMYHVPSFHK